jgi:hypothetical protein
MNPNIQITRISVEPSDGWLLASYCSICKQTVFLLNQYAVKPKDGDYFLIKMCVDNLSHDIQFTKTSYNLETA